MKKFLLFAAAALASSGAFAAEQVLAEVDFSKMDSYTMWKGSAGEFQIKDGALEVSNAEATANFWDVQYFVADNLSVAADTDYKVAVKIKGFSGPLHYVLGAWGTDVFTGAANVEASADWQTVTFGGTAAADTDGVHLLLQSGEFVGSYYIESVKITYEEKSENPSDPKEEKVLLSMYPGDATLGGWGDGFVGEAVTEDGREAYKVSHPAKSSNPWDAQYAFDYSFEAGTTYYLTFDVKGDEGTVTSGLQQTDGYKGCGNFTNFQVSNDWQTVTIKCTAQTSENGDANRYVANVGDYVGTLYISNLKLYVLADSGSAVESVTSVAAPAGVYNLNGVKVADEPGNALPKGIYIVNGKKVVR